MISEPKKTFEAYVYSGLETYFYTGLYDDEDIAVSPVFSTIFQDCIGRPWEM